jgi:hypothetical protein
MGGALIELSSDSMKPAASVHARLHLRSRMTRMLDAEACRVARAAADQEMIAIGPTRRAAKAAQRKFTVWPLNNAPSGAVNSMNPGHVDAARLPRLAAQARDAVRQRSGFNVDRVG